MSDYNVVVIGAGNGGLPTDTYIGPFGSQGNRQVNERLMN